MCAGLTAFAQGSVRVQTKSLVALGEQFNVTVTVSGTSNPSEPAWNPGNDFQLAWGPQRVGSSSSVSIVNGKSTRSVTYTYVFILVAKNKGKFTLPPVECEIDGEKCLSNSVRIEVAEDSGSAARSEQEESQNRDGQNPVREPSVSGKEKSADAFLRFSISKSRVVVGEPVKAVLKLYTRTDVVGFEDAKLPTFNGFWSQETYSPKNIEFQRENIGGKMYLSAVLREYTLIPQQTGKVTIEPAEITCVMQIRTSSPTGSIFDSLFEEYQTVRRKAVSAGYTLNVSPLPDGAPASFGGGVGQFSISAEMPSGELETHQASSVRLTVSGSGNIVLVEAPRLNLPSDFEVYDVKVTERIDAARLSGSKTFEYPFIPRSSGDFTIGPIEYSYYDDQKGQYVTTSAGPFRVNVAKGNVKSDNVSSGLQAVSKKDVKNLGEDIRYISVKNPSLTEKGRFFAGSAVHLSLLGLMLALGLAAFAALKKFFALKSDVALTKNRAATKMARKRLASAGELLKKNLYSAFYEELHKAMLGFAADKLTMDVTQLSKENIQAELIQRGVGSDVASRFTQILDACEYARYSPAQGTEEMTAEYSSAIQVISTIDSEMKTIRKKPASNATYILLCALALSAAGQVPARAEADCDSLWLSGVNAYSEGNHEEALDAWKAIESAGYESAELYCNMGDAYFRTGQTGYAILYYEKALKLDPSGSDARHNLNFASAGITDEFERIPDFFLKKWAESLSRIFSADLWAVLSIIFLGIAVASVLLFLLGGRSSLRKLGFSFAVAGLLLFAVSLCSALSQRSSYFREDAAIVVEQICPARSSPSESGASELFVVHEGTRLKVLDTVGEWNNVELPDGRSGWVESRRIRMI